MYKSEPYYGSMLPFHVWIGYHGGFNWHLKLALVSDNGKRTSWPVGDDLDLAKEELFITSCLEF